MRSARFHFAPATRSRRCPPLLPAARAVAQGFDKINTTVTNVKAILVTISIAVVTIAIIWAGFKMIFQGARLADVANVLIGGTLIGGAAAFAELHRHLRRATMQPKPSTRARRGRP